MQIPFYYDYACPWAYLGSCRVEPYFADLGVEIDFRPVILARLKEPTAPKGLELGERKKHNYIDDLKRWAEMIGAESIDQEKTDVVSGAFSSRGPEPCDQHQPGEYHTDASRRQPPDPQPGRKSTACHFAFLPEAAESIK